MKKIKKLWHRVEHYFGWNTGRVEVWYAGQQLMVGFMCDGCHRIDSVHEFPDSYTHFSADVH
jgi:hypothetical protein